MSKEKNSLIDMHNRISAAQLEKVLRMQVRTLAEHPELAKVLPPLMVWGAPGLGKSSIIRGIADEMGIQFSAFCAPSEAGPRPLQHRRRPGNPFHSRRREDARALRAPSRSDLARTLRRGNLREVARLPQKKEAEREAHGGRNVATRGRSRQQCLWQRPRRFRQAHLPGRYPPQPK